MEVCFIAVMVLGSLISLLAFRMNDKNKVIGEWINLYFDEVEKNNKLESEIEKLKGYSK